MLRTCDKNGDWLLLTLAEQGSLRTILWLLAIAETPQTLLIVDYYLQIQHNSER